MGNATTAAPDSRNGVEMLIRRLPLATRNAIRMAAFRAGISANELATTILNEWVTKHPAETKP